MLLIPWILFSYKFMGYFAQSPPKKKSIQKIECHIYIYGDFKTGFYQT